MHVPSPIPTATLFNNAGSTDVSGGDSAATAVDDDAAEKTTPNHADDAYAMASLSIVGIVGAGMLLGSAMSYQARKSRAAAGDVDTGPQGHGADEMAPGTDESLNGRNTLHSICGVDSAVSFEASKRRNPDEVEEI